MSIDVDTREFQAAMKEAIRTSSRTAAVVINTKHQDLLWKAGKKCPSAKKEYKRQFIKSPPAFVTFMATQQHGKGFKRQMRSAIWQAWYPSLSGKQFLKSGFFKAGDAFKKINRTADGKEFKPAYKHGPRPTRFRVREAAGTQRVQVAASEISWKSDKSRPSDARLKESVLMRALRSGMAVVTADTRRHMANKLAKELAKLSAKGAR